METLPCRQVGTMINDLQTGRRMVQFDRLIIIIIIVTSKAEPYIALHAVMPKHKQSVMEIGQLPEGK